MTSTVFPSEEEAEALLLTPDSFCWNVLGDARLYLSAGFALILQVAHPTVDSGVREHSDFKRDPWGRLLRTLDYFNLLVYGGREAIPMGHRLRDMHKSIKGTNADGSHYHALEPEAYAWVHATLIEGSVAAHTRFIGPLSRARVERLYSEYRPLGRLIGVRERDLPESWDGFREYFDEMIETKLERTESVGDVLDLLGRPAPPDVRIPGLDLLWPLLAAAPSEALSIATAGLLTPAARDKLGIEWSDRRQLELRALGRATRALTPVMPARLRNVGPDYLRIRREAIAAGQLGAD